MEGMMEEKVEDQPDGHVLGLWEETGRHPHPEDVESPPRNSQNRESNPQPEDRSCPKTQTSRKTPVFISPVFVLSQKKQVLSHLFLCFSGRLKVAAHTELKKPPG